MTIPAWVFGVVPSIGVGLVFWFAMRSVIRADRHERQALAELEEQRSQDSA